MKHISMLILPLIATAQFLAAAPERETTKKPPIKVGQALIIEASLNKGTGYSWVHVPSQKSRGLLEITPLKEESTGKPMPGKPVMQRWQIRGLKPGKERFRIEERRPWEKEPIRIKEFVITVQ
jgi:predicted secreted protein